MTSQHSWADPYSINYRPELAELIKDVALAKSHLAKNVWQVHVDKEDIISELYAVLFTEPKLVADNKFPSKILHDRASKFCFKQRKDQGAAILGTDSLHAILTEFNSMPSYIREMLYGPVFTKAGKPSGSYLEAIEQEYKYKNKVLGASNRKTLARAVTRLAEVISGIMVGTPDSFTVISENSKIPSYEMEDYDDSANDPTLAPYTGIYFCSNKHMYRINTGAKPSNNRIGQRNYLGYYTCRCGEILKLDTRELVDE